MPLQLQTDCCQQHVPCAIGKKIDVQLQLLVDSRSLFLPVQPYTLSAACALQKLKLPLSAARTLQNTPLLIHTPHPARHTNPMTHLECRVCPEQAHRHTAPTHTLQLMRALSPPPPPSSPTHKASLCDVHTHKTIEKYLHCALQKNPMQQLCQHTLSAACALKKPTGTLPAAMMPAVVSPRCQQSSLAWG